MKLHLWWCNLMCVLSNKLMYSTKYLLGVTEERWGGHLTWMNSALQISFFGYVIHIDEIHGPVTTIWCVSHDFILLHRLAQHPSLSQLVIIGVGGCLIFGRISSGSDITRCWGLSILEIPLLLATEISAPRVIICCHVRVGHHLLHDNHFPYKQQHYCVLQQITSKCYRGCLMWMAKCLGPWMFCHCRGICGISETEMMLIQI
jgi:hypothetical protein